MSYIYEKNEEHKVEISNINKSIDHLTQSIAIIIREFEYFENDIIDTIHSIRNILPNVKIFIISDSLPYPPIFVDEYQGNVKMVSLKSSLNKPFQLQQPLNMIENDHIFIFPDSVRLENVSQISKMLEKHYHYPHNIIAAPVVGEELHCFSLNVSLRFWTMKYQKKVEKSICNAVQGSHVILIAKTLLMQFGFPFSKPFSTSIYVQATLKKIQTRIVADVVYKRGKILYTNAHNKWKHDALEMKRKVQLYEDLGIKKIIHPAARVEWYGCNKNSNRCFGTVVNNMPEYLFQGRWTPPCCLENLRQTARYVFGILEKCNVRYWLEGGSLLGAIRNGDIIPWDYDVDIGIYKDDIVKCEWLKNSLQQSIVDTQGFLWEKAREGDFIRVQFSQSNHLHVDIFPFYSKNGTMTKDTWFADHKQDMEFPEYFLKPLHKIKFVGMVTYSPNNCKKFLEMKFGRGVIENPEYPNPELMKFQRRAH